MCLIFVFILVDFLFLFSFEPILLEDIAKVKCGGVIGAKFDHIFSLFLPAFVTLLMLHGCYLTMFCRIFVEEQNTGK